MSYLVTYRKIFFLIAINFLLWNWVMPVFEPADESGHYAHILYIWKQRRLPSLVELSPTEKGVGYTTYPPLYYWSFIPLAKLVDAPLESEELLPYHPQKELFKKSVFSVYLHTKDELFLKWNSLALSVHLLRIQTSVYGLLTVYLVYLTGKKMFGEESRKPLLAAALVGLNPMFAHISNSIVNVNLNILLFSLFFYLAVNSLQKSSRVSAKERGDLPLNLDCHGVKRLAMTIASFVKTLNINFVLGLIAGVAYLTKITGLMLIPIWGVFVLCRFRIPPSLTVCLQELFVRGSRSAIWRAGKSGMTLKGILAFVTGFILAAGWYLARNLKLYGSLLETSVAIKHFGRPAMQLEVSGPINYWIGFIQTNFKTFFSGYGMLTVNLPDGILFLLLIIVLIGIWGNMIYKKEDQLRSFLKGSFLIILLGHIIVNINIEAFHARDLFIGMVPFSLLFVDGVSIWLKFLESGQLWSRRIVSSLIYFTFLTVALFHFLQPVMVELAKLVLTGSNGLFPVIMKLAGFIIAFCIFWLAFRKFSYKIAEAIAKVSSNKNFLLNLAGGLFLTNIMILILLVIPKLYQL